MTTPDPTQALLAAVRAGLRPPEDLANICPVHFVYGLYAVDGKVRCPVCERERDTRVKWIAGREGRHVPPATRELPRPTSELSTEG